MSLGINNTIKIREIINKGMMGDVMGGNKLRVMDKIWKFWKEY